MATFAVFGTGTVGQSLAGRLSQPGNTITVGTRNVENTLARTGNDMYGNPPYSEWLKQHPDIRTATFEEAASISDIIVNCTMGHASLAALNSAGASNLNGKILIDIANPLDFSQGFPPTLFLSNTSSLGEQIQQTFPGLKVVKTLNTMNAHLMVNPALIQGDHTVFVSGNDKDAKSAVSDILRSFGWKDHNILDLGDITTARGTEMLLPAWVRIYSALQTPMFNFQINVGR